MILSDRTIWECLRNGQIEITPSIGQTNIRPNGIRVHLSNQILIPPTDLLVDPLSPQKLDFQAIDISADPYIIERGKFILGATIEAVRLSRSLTCHIDGRSTLARLGLMVHCSSSVFDNVHDEARAPTLELINLGPFDLKLSAGMPIAMLLFSQLSSEIEQASQEQYRGQTGPVAPNLAFRIRGNDDR